MGDHFRPSRIAGGISAEKSLDEIVSRNALAQIRRDPPPRHPVEARGNKGAGDVDIVASMAKRLSVIERELKDKAFLMTRVQAENDVLKAKLKASEDELQRKASQHSSAAPCSSHPPHVAAEDGASHTRSEVARLRSQLRYAWKQVAEMKQFLGDYGLVWVGEPDTEGLGDPSVESVPEVHRGDSSVSAGSGSSGGAGLPPHPPAQDRSSVGAGPRRRVSSTGGGPVEPPSSSHPRGCTGAASSAAMPPKGLPCSLERLMSAVSQLNQVAGDGEGRLVGGGGGHGAVLHTPDPIRLVLYSDGLQVHRSPPKAYDDPASKGVLKDIIDGYFPIVLKKEFPDGVPIKVIDRTSECIASAGASAAAAVAARSGGGANVRSFQDLEEDQSAPIPRDKFLRQLPQTVIKNGKVIDIRSEIGKLVGVHQHAGEKGSIVALVSTTADALLTTSQRNHVGPNLPPPSRDVSAKPSTSGSTAAAAASISQSQQRSSTQQEIATLQVKSEDGKQTFILKLQYDETIFALRKYIDAHREKLAKEQGKPAPVSKSYEIRSAFPARAYNEAKETLREAGLVPNATLFLKAI